MKEEVQVAGTYREPPIFGKRKITSKLSLEEANNVFESKDWSRFLPGNSQIQKEER